MELELSMEQVAGLCAIDAKGFVQAIEKDIVRDYPGLAQAGLTERLAAALTRSRAIGIDEDVNLVHFLRTEALAPSFYKQPGFCRWMEKPGRSADQRFHDFLQVIHWKLRHETRQQQAK